MNFETEMDTNERGGEGWWWSQQICGCEVKKRAEIQCTCTVITTVSF